jgi:outer membrane lipoprotein SlyB
LEAYKSDQAAKALEKERQAAQDLADEIARAKNEVESLAATIITDLGNAIREGDASGLAESIGGALGGAVGMLAGGPVGAALGSQLGALWGQTMGKAFQSPEFLQEAEEAMAQMGSTLSSIISDGGTLKEFANALDQQMREIVVEQAVKAFALEKDLKKLGKKIARAMEDGVISASEEADISALKSKISRKAERIQSGVSGVYEDLGITPSRPEAATEDAAPQPYIGPVQTAGAPTTVVNNHVTVQGSVMTEDEVSDHIFSNQFRRYN